MLIILFYYSRLVWLCIRAWYFERITPKSIWFLATYVKLTFWISNQFWHLTVALCGLVNVEATLYISDGVKIQDRENIRKRLVTHVTEITGKFPPSNKQKVGLLLIHQFCKLLKT